jgi:hypothetical protein
MSDCPNSTEAEAVEFVTAYKKAREARKPKLSALGGATGETTGTHTAYIPTENLGVKGMSLADTGAIYSATARKDVDDAIARGFPVILERLPQPVTLSMAVVGSDTVTDIVVTETLLSAVTIATPGGPLCMRGTRQVIVAEGLDMPIIGRPALDEIGFSAPQHLSAVRDTYNMHDFSHVSQELTEMADKPTGALVRLLLKPAGSPSEIKDWIAADPSLAECDNEMPQLVSDSEDEDDCKTHKNRVSKAASRWTRQWR